MEQLRNEIRRHDRLYYEEAAPIVSDREYDRLTKNSSIWRAVSRSSYARVTTQSVGGKPLKAFEQVPHLIPMLSLDNTYSEEEVKNFYARIQRLLPNEKISVVIEPKVDGVAVFAQFTKMAGCVRQQRAGWNGRRRYLLKISERSVRCQIDCAALLRNFWKRAAKSTWINMALEN